MANKIQLTVITTRSSERVPFYAAPSFSLQNQKEKFENTKKIFQKSSWISSDKLVRTSIYHFDSIESWKEYLTDPVRVESNKIRDSYLEEHGHGLTTCVQEYNLSDGVVKSSIKEVFQLRYDSYSMDGTPEKSIDLFSEE